MKVNKILLGGIAGGVIFQLIGSLIFYVVLKDYVAANYNQSIGNPDYNTWGLENMFSNLFMGLLVSYIFSLAQTTRLVSGLITGGIVGLLLNISIDLWLNASVKMFNSFNVALVDILINGAIFAIAGAVAAWAMSKIQD